MKRTNYKSGEKYRIGDLFSGANDKINVPDLQRDYCWSTQPMLVENFINNLLEQFENLNPDSDAGVIRYSEVPMGLIYGYFDRYNSGHLQLCDGQQRLTTIFLLLGVINRRLEDNSLQKWLMSDFEMIRDDHEPYLRYEIRESSLYFLVDLTYGYFFRQDNESEYSDKIEEQSWFIDEYNLDPTVTQIISAITKIETALKDVSIEKLRGFADFIVHLPFLYLDMETREKGEETFVIINTTGEPLTPTQNIKPLIINKVASVSSYDGEDIAKRKAAGHSWEDIEKWCWENRGEDETNDNGLRRFLYAVSVYEAEDREKAYLRVIEPAFPYKEIEFSNIVDAFEAYRRIYRYTDISETGDNPLTAKNLYILLPAMAYLTKFPDASDEELMREMHVFKNITRYRDVSNVRKDSQVPAFIAKEYVKRQSSKDVLSLIEVWEGLKGEYIIEEITKLKFISKFKDDEALRTRIEKCLYSLEDMSVFDGMIGNIVEWVSDNVSRLFDIQDRLIELFNKGDEILNLVRRVGLVRGYTPKAGSFWHEWAELREMIKQNNDDFLTLISTFKKERIKEALLNEIRDNRDRYVRSKYYRVIIDEELIKKLQYKRFRDRGNGLLLLLGRKRTSSAYWYTWHDTCIPDGKNDSFFTGIWDWQGSLFIDCKGYNVRLECDLRNGRFHANWEVHPERIHATETQKESIRNYMDSNPFTEADFEIKFKSLREYVINILSPDKG